MGTIFFKRGMVEYKGFLFPLTEKQEKEYSVLLEEAWQDNIAGAEPCSGDLLVAPGVHRRQWFSWGEAAREDEIIFFQECTPELRDEIATRLFSEQDK